VYKIIDSEMYIHTEVPDKAESIRSRHPETSLYVIDPAAKQHLEGSGARTVRRIYQENGINPLVLCKSNDRVSGWEALRSAFYDGNIVINRDTCGDLIGSLSALITKDTDSQDCEKDDGGDYQRDGDHLADALRYMYVNGFYYGDTEEDKIIIRTREILDNDPLAVEAIRDARR